MSARRRAVLFAAAVLLAAAPAAAEPAPRVLIIPTSPPLKGKLAGAPARFDKALADVVTEIGAEPLTARVGKKEITAIIGCADGESTECFEESVVTLGVDRILFAQTAQQPDGTTTVSLTYFQTGQPVRRSQVQIAGDDPAAATEQVRVAATLLVRGPEPEPIVAPPQPPPPPPQQPPPPPPGPGFSFGRVHGWTWGVTGGGAVLLGASALFFVLAGDKQDQVDAAPTDTLDDLRRLQDLESSGKRLTLLGNISLVAGAAALTTGAVLIWRQGRAPAEQPAVAVAPISGGGAALVWSGRF